MVRRISGKDLKRAIDDLASVEDITTVTVTTTIKKIQRNI